MRALALDEGDRFYVVADGTIEVTRNGRWVRTLVRGDGFGEVALLHSCLRTATCTARDDAALYALARHDFLTVITGHLQANREARKLAAARTGVEPSPTVLDA